MAGFLRDTGLTAARQAASDDCRNVCSHLVKRQLDFLVGSESDVRQWGPLPGGPVRPSGPCCFAVSHAPGKGGSKQLPELLF